MSEDISKIVDLGACRVTINSVIAGHTNEEGTKVTLTSEIIRSMVAKFGKAFVRHFLNGQAATVEFILQQTEFDVLAQILPGGTVVTDSGGDKKITFGKIGGTPLTAVTLVLTPFLSANTPLYDFSMYCVPVGDFEIVYDGGKVQGWKCKFEGSINEAGGANGSYLATFGDSSITQDVTAPTATVVPADAATGVAVGDNVVWTFSEELDGNSVNADNVILFKDPTGSGMTGLEVAGSVTLVNNGASTTITFNPTASLSASTKYIAVLRNIKDKAGNELASGLQASEFTTA